jgi:hypothetical protein
MKIALLVSVLMLFGGGAMAEAQEFGIIARTYEDGFPLIFKLVDELPDEQTRSALPWLTAITWEYDGAANNGMPSESVLEKMKALEKAIEEKLSAPGFCHHAYSRTGNGLKVLTYYVSDQDQFMEGLNSVLNDHPRYPIEIDFHEDADWDVFQKLLKQVRKGEDSNA